MGLFAQTPKVGDVPLGGIGSSALFTEDSGLGPEPVLPSRYGNGVDNKVPPAALLFAVLVSASRNSAVDLKMCQD